ncbi:hypothetical protein VOLCADRAFT_106093 [Volvox carteri f. nagariensis]|uniref:AB hydrolase-1 domain-containing protein n=1 Tax=Volvox carteri f. nagariensis TaxID=3068 RepID=D8U514_VOLCA|nr:uncharacterized protein VOLCADRAFT_106093 [Volvox carteri f. nagariensis]EFJ45067.1 hypothetical protein VOLCADRAFT_106093 [Volvox carteri f. nagariensis]|eukprot:XP_002953743.1 hypothetical protein VOLCADRAFT_106093 [Volvox carteri f. nagariensis]
MKVQLRGHEIPGHGKSSPNKAPAARLPETTRTTGLTHRPRSWGRGWSPCLLHPAQQLARPCHGRLKLDASPNSHPLVDQIHPVAADLLTRGQGGGAPGAASLPGDRVDPPVVMMPGYGAGVGFYYRNFPSLARQLRLFAVDWLGTGLSGRPPYRARTREQAEDFFLTSLAEWRRAAGLEGSKMVLVGLDVPGIQGGVGHSLGGYLAANYALRYPEHVQHLVLVCPAGVPKAPEDWERRWLGDKWSWRGQMFKMFMWGWEKGVTPGAIIRGLGPWGQNLVFKYVANRFSHHGEGLSQREIDLFKEYFYSIAALPGSGEYALRHLLAPGAWAHAPLEERLHELKVPVTFIYGRHDWMRPEYAVQLCARLRKERPPSAPNDLTVEIIDDAGHFVFLDQPELFDKALTNVVLPYLRTARQRERAAAYVTAGTEVQVAPEAKGVADTAERAAGAARETAAATSTATATSWGFAASGVAPRTPGAGEQK